MELWRYYRIIRRRRWLIILLMAVTVVSVAIANRFTTPLYTGRTTVMERQPGPEEGVPVFQEYRPIPNVEVHLADLGNIATSQEVMRRSADTLQALGITLDPMRLLRTVSVRPVQDTQILAIEVTSTDPEEAKAAADVIANEFKKFYADIVHGATSLSREFIEGQVLEAKKQLEAAQEARKKFKEKEGVVDLTGQSTVLIQRVQQLDNELTNATVAYNDAAARYAVIGKQLEKEPEFRNSGRVIAQNPIWLQLMQERIRLETEMGSQIARRGPKHPDVQQLQKQLDEIKARLDKEQERIINQESVQTNPIYANNLDRYITAKAEMEASQARKAALEAARAELLPTMDAMPSREMKMAQLELDQKLAEQTYQLLVQKLDEARIKEQESQKRVGIKVIDSAYVFPVDQKKGVKILLALIFSPLLGIGLALMLNYLDNTVKTPSEAEELLGLPVFSAVPLARAHSLVRRADAAVQAAYQMLSTNLWTTVAETDRPTVLVASAEPDTGRSVTAANLSVTLAREGAKVILVDADMRKPTQHLMFGVDNKRGLSNILSGIAEIEDAVVPTKIEGLLLIPAGPAPDNPVRLLRSVEMRDFVEEISKLADFAIFDSPAGVTFADPVLIAAHVHNIVIVHSAGKVPRGAENEFRNRLEQVDVNLIGVVLNRVRPEDSHGYFHFRRSYQDVTMALAKRDSTAVRAIPPDTGKGDEQDRR